MASIDSSVNKNERSWGIELISQINDYVKNKDLVIKRAGGETTITDGKQKKFPDVVLYADATLTRIVQGWELKMPDVDIMDNGFVADAHRKAMALGLSSCVIWNFSYAKFYICDGGKTTFTVAREWANPNIKTRADVEYHTNEWLPTLFDVVLVVNEYLLNNRIQSVSVGDIISRNAIDFLIKEDKTLIAAHYREKSISDVVLDAYIDAWWQSEKTEYLLDETDKYVAYAKVVLLNWAYRLIFAHLIKRKQNKAFLVDSITTDTTPEEANAIFEEITRYCDFYNVFAGMDYGHILPTEVWDDLVELSLFLKENGIENIEQAMLQNILEGAVNTNRRELKGQFTTPEILARLLVAITVRDWRKDTGDPCCGTGTIARELLYQKSKKLCSMTKALDSTWASDKHSLPLQLANFSLTSEEGMNIPIKLFKANAIELNIGRDVEFINPADGEKITFAIPKFGAICSNLPFLTGEMLPNDDREYISKDKKLSLLNGRTDLYQYIAIHLSELLEDEGYLGIITSNSWLGTSISDKFFNELNVYYDIKQVHISGKGRWFQNAKVVTTIIILQKKKEFAETDNKTCFFVWKQSLEEIEASEEIQRCIVNSSLLGKVQDEAILSPSEYTLSEIRSLRSLNISYNALFHDVRWLLNVKEKLLPIESIFKTIRGSRRGWDKLFFPKEGHNIEPVFLFPALFNARGVEKLIATPDREAFCCSKPLPELEKDYPNAYKWVKGFEKQFNGTGIPLPEILQRPNYEWYELKPNEIVPLFTMMNPDDRIFFGRFKKPSFINQRLIGFSPIEKATDIELCHALLNTILVKFFVEATGFGRGLGVLDVNKENIAKCYMLNPNILSDEQIRVIKEKFSTILRKRIISIEEELSDSDWIEFNKTVFGVYGLERYYTEIADSLISLRKLRKAVKL